MEIREFREGDVLVLAPDGNVAGREDTGAIETALGAALKAGVRLLILDCAAVGQLASTAIRVLLLTSRKLDRTTGRLVLCGMNGKLKKAFLISGFDKDFTVVATREEALLRVLEPVQPRPPRAAKPSPPKIVQSGPSMVSPPVDAGNPPPPVPEVPSAAAQRLPAARPAAPAAIAALVARPAVPDRREALAAVLLDALGVRLPDPDAARASRPARPDFDALASGILAALRAGRS
jgi:anti-anti-sigma factor